MTERKKYTDRDLERTYHHARENDWDFTVNARLFEFTVEDLAEVYMDERERFAKMAEDFSREQRARGFEVRARVLEEMAERIRADRGGL